MATTGPQRTRRTAEERRSDVLDALIEFATYRLHGASTVDIAERAGISQPYMLRLFGTKKALVLDTVAMARHLIEAAWQRAADASPVDASPRQRPEALGEAFQGLATRKEVLRLLLQACCAAADDEVRAQCQAAMRGLFGWVRETTGAPRALDEEWARALTRRRVKRNEGRSCRPEVVIDQFQARATRRPPGTPAC